MDSPTLPLPQSTSRKTPRSGLAGFVESERFRAVVTVAVVLNAIVLGLVTYDGLPTLVQQWCGRLDSFFLMLFVVELLLKLFAWRGRFFLSAWNLFDFVVVAISLIAVGPFSVLRAFRILRTLRILSAVPTMRRVVEALIRAIPGISAILGVMMIFFYVSAVLTTNMFGEEFPELFGALGSSTITLFQLMLFDNWGDIIREVGATHPMAPTFFFVFTVISAFAVLNLFIAVMVDSLRTEHDRLQENDLEELEEGQHLHRRELEAVDMSVKALDAKVDVMLEKLEAMRAASAARQEGEP